MTSTTANRSKLVEHSFDIVVVGSGPAGVAFAREFLQTDQKVAIVESGGLHRDDEADALNEIEAVGQTRAPHKTVGCRGFGGSSFLWTGRCGTLDDIDFHARSWLPHTGWPINFEHLAPYYQRAGRFLGIAPTNSAEISSRELYQSFDSPPVSSSAFKPVVWQFSRSDSTSDFGTRDFTPEGNLPTELLQHTGAPAAVNVGQRYGEVIHASQNVHLFTSTTVLEILTDPNSGHASGLIANGSNHEKFAIKAPIVVIAAGGIQNPRLLLASTSSNPKGLGNNYDQVGRYLADHHFSEIAVFRGPQGKNLRRRLGSRWHPSMARSRVHVLGMRLAEEVQRKNKLLNASLHIAEFGSGQNPVSSIGSGARHLRNGQIKDATGDFANALSRPGGLISGGIDRLVKRRPPLNSPDRSVVGCALEQELQWDSRVSLSDVKDRLGMPIARVDWRISDREYQTVRWVEELFHDEAQRLGFGAYERPAWRDGDAEQWKAGLLDLAHPSCTTRMSLDPKRGVVDENCQVHGVPGLYVAGSSVFSTNSHMNPTQTLVALSIRLADHIKKQFTPLRPAISSAKTQRLVRVGIVGGGHRAETVYAPVMKALSEDIEVCGVVTRTPEGSLRISEKTGWSSTTNLREFLDNENPDLLIAAVSPEAVDLMYVDLVEHGTPLLLETPSCWNANTGRSVKAAIERKQVPVGVAEQFPHLPEMQLKRKLISLGLVGQVNAVISDFGMFDYHGMATLKSLIGSHRRPVSVQGKHVHLGSGEQCLSGTVSFDDGSYVEHRFSGRSENATHWNPGSVIVSGSLGTLVSGEARFTVSKGDYLTSQIIREEVDGDLKALSVETPDGPVKWDNPFANHGLDDEQIAVGCLVKSMADVVRFSGSPIYPYWSALEDVELINALRYSAVRQGRKIQVPTSHTMQKAILKSQGIFRNTPLFNTKQGPVNTAPKN